MDLKAWLQELIRRQPRFRGGGTLLRRADVIARWRLHELDRAWTATSLAADASSLDRFEAWRGRKGPTVATPEEVACFLRAEITRGLTRPQVSQHRPRPLACTSRHRPRRSDHARARAGGRARSADCARRSCRDDRAVAPRPARAGRHDHLQLRGHARPVRAFLRLTWTGGLSCLGAVHRGIPAPSHGSAQEEPARAGEAGLGGHPQRAPLRRVPGPHLRERGREHDAPPAQVLATDIEDPALWRPVLARWRLDQVYLAPARAVTVGRHLERFERFCAERGVQPDAADAG